MALSGTEKAPALTPTMNKAKIIGYFNAGVANASGKLKSAIPRQARGIKPVSIRSREIIPASAEPTPIPSASSRKQHPGAQFLEAQRSPSPDHHVAQNQATQSPEVSQAEHGQGQRPRGENDFHVAFELGQRSWAQSGGAGWPAPYVRSPDPGSVR